MEALIERAKRLQEKKIFLGGPPHLFEIAGRKQLMTLLSEGLAPQSKVLDIGCGCLRRGYWLIHFLDSGCYYGIEPNSSMLEAGREILLEPNLLELKQPQFDHNDRFDLSVFDQKFDFFVARSIWTHASRGQIRVMLDGFVSYSSPHAVFITSYLKPTLTKWDYKGNAWVGKSHQSDRAGLVRHGLRWIRRECSQRGLVVDEIRDSICNFSNQIWLKVQAR